MLVLLPPSEGKTPGGEGPPVGRRPSFGAPGLARPRAELLEALRRAARAAPEDLCRGLKLPTSVAPAALKAVASAATAPTMAALDRYAGVVYQGLDVASLSAAARARADEQVLVVSGLWGVVRGGEQVPDYRVPAAGRVPGLGGVAAHWRRPLADVLPGLVGDRTVLDLRSSDYLGMWRPDADLRDRVLVVRVLAERVSGSSRTTSAVSYHAKWVKGLVTRHLVRSRRQWKDPWSALADAAGALDLRVVDTSTGGPRGGWSADLVGRYP